MRFFKILTAIVMSISLIASVSACGLKPGWQSRLNEELDGRVRKTGDNYIDYLNADRTQIVEPYVGEMLDSKTADAILEKIVFQYETVDGKPDTYRWYIDNSDVEYFFDGVIQLTKGNTNYEINVYMLPPEDYEFFELEMEGDPGDYEISIKANLYYWSDKAPEPDTPSVIHNIVGDDTRFLVEVDADSLTKDIMTDYADYIYALDTIYNRKEISTYHFILSSDFDGVDYSKSKYMMLVNAADHRVDVYDTKGNTFLSEEY